MIGINCANGLTNEDPSVVAGEKLTQQTTFPETNISVVCISVSGVDEKRPGDGLASSLARILSVCLR